MAHSRASDCGFRGAGLPRRRGPGKSGGSICCGAVVLSHADFPRSGGEPDSYLDDAVGYLEKNGQGRMAVTRVVLRPRITWAEGTSVSEEDLNKLHHQAHEGCFIANSVTTDVRVESVL
jgi:hypothetical protein